jgi:YbbR domain-containing protein
MIRWLVENLSLMLLALIIAVVVWIAAEWERDRIVEDEFDRPIPVQVINQPVGTHLVEGWTQEVRVRLKAPQSVWNQLKPEDFGAILDLSPNSSPLEPGEYRIGVQVSLDVEQTILLDVEPAIIEVALEAIRERTMPVQVDIRNEPELSYQAEEPVVAPETVQVVGPASLVDQVQQVVTSVSLQGARATVKNDAAALTPVDASGRRVNGVTLTPETVQITVPIRQQSNFKEMTVKPEILGQPAEDYYVAEVRLNPPMVLVFGSRDVLNDLPGFLSTVPISIAGRTEDVTERLPLELPPGVATVNPNEPAVQVYINIEPFLGSVTITRTVTFQGLRPGWSAVASPEVVQVLLSGPLPRLSVLLSEDVRVVLDLSDLSLGDQAQLTPVIIPPEGITVDSVIPAVIQVQVVRAPTPTPQP